VGAELASRGHSLVYGGGCVGMMGVLARAVKEGRGRVTGVIPRFMQERELAFAEADEMLVVEDMRERKRLMEQYAQAFVVMPGGWGTLDELMELLTLRQLDVVRKPVVLLNHQGFFDPLLTWFSGLAGEGFNRPENLSLYHVVEGGSAALDQVETGGLGRVDAAWFVTK
jgi:cytokinin riboside 5'-monophosphate phosphoribohydrolase